MVSNVVERLKGVENNLQRPPARFYVALIPEQKYCPPTGSQGSRESRTLVTLHFGGPNKKNPDSPTQ